MQSLPTSDDYFVVLFLGQCIRDSLDSISALDIRVALSAAASQVCHLLKALLVSTLVFHSKIVHVLEENFIATQDMPLTVPWKAKASVQMVGPSLLFHHLNPA